ncbi:fumarylacetoacetate hydrolase family protein [Bordetella genomosp. 12]|uniref:Fumarylacetoacetate hydrolase n=1 Tax=Bordetella genomosp. 12 TaxID=463035 RepID=A0A261VM45_9BORD|nr:fumarylacetoacetate hydrolase family protein [Bordetella genomosp. 12]OZI74821.1 fumarylacetoacetate hydrolase [Bordetella genomosp. 12]
MSNYVIAAPERASAAVAGSSQRFPIRRVFCVGRNYAEHAREMGHDPDREPPFFFTKPADAVVPAQGTLPYPPLTEDLHHEIEMVVAIGKGGVNIAVDDALTHVWGYAVGLDLTRRDLQAQAKKLGRPWDWSKAFDASGPITPLRAASDIGHPQKGRIWLEVNGAVRQQGDLAELIWSVPEVIAAISRSVALQPGDLIFTGTPAGVAALQPGDVAHGGADGIGEFELTIGPKPQA